MAKSRRRIVYIIVAVVLVLGIAAYLLRPTRPLHFDTDKWKSTPSEFSRTSVRLRMAEDFLESEQPIGRSRREIVALLGEPDATGYFSDYDMVYHLGQEPGFIGIDSLWLVIRLDDSDVVTEAALVTD